MGCETKKNNTDLDENQLKMPRKCGTPLLTLDSFQPLCRMRRDAHHRRRRASGRKARVESQHFWQERHSQSPQHDAGRRYQTEVGADVDDADEPNNSADGRGEDACSVIEASGDRCQPHPRKSLDKAEITCGRLQLRSSVFGSVVCIERPVWPARKSEGCIISRMNQFQTQRRISIIKQLHCTSSPINSRTFLIFIKARQVREKWQNCR